MARGFLQARSSAFDSRSANVSPRNSANRHSGRETLLSIRGARPSRTHHSASRRMVRRRERTPTSTSTPFRFPFCDWRRFGGHGNLAPSKCYGPGDRQLRFVYLQPRAVPGRVAGGFAGPSQRPDFPRPDSRAESRTDSHFAGTVLAARIGPVQRHYSHVWAEDTVVWSLPGPSMHRAYFRGGGGGQLPDDAREDLADPAQWQGPFRRHAQPVRGDALSFAGDQTRNDARVPANHRGKRRRRDHGGAAQGLSDLGGAVSSRKHPDRKRASDCQKLPETGQLLVTGESLAAPPAALTTAPTAGPIPHRYCRSSGKGGCIVFPTDPRAGRL